MDTALIIAITSSLTAILTALLTPYFTKRREFDSAERIRKIECYGRLYDSMTAIATNDPNASQLFAQACNAMFLVAPQDVLDALVKMHKDASTVGIKIDSPVFKSLIIKMRNDLGVHTLDNIESFPGLLVGRVTGPNKAYSADAKSRAADQPRYSGLKLTQKPKGGENEKRYLQSVFPNPVG